MPRAQQQDMRDLGASFISRWADPKVVPLRAAAAADGQYPTATILFEREERLDLGGVHVRLFLKGPLHTHGDTLIWVEEDRVLFTGEVVQKDTFLGPGTGFR